MLLRKIPALSLALAVAVPSTVAAQSGLPRTLYSRGPLNAQALAGEVLARHNVERLPVGVPPH